MKVIAYNIETKIVQVREDILPHADMEKGYPWVYIDANGIKYYPVYFNNKHKIAVVLSGE